MANRYFADVSNNNSQRMDFDKYRNQGQHVLLGLKASEGHTFVDHTHHPRAGAAHNAGCWVLHYHFGHAGRSASQQAQFFWERIKPVFRGHDVACIDIEGGGMDGHGAYDTARWTTAFATAFTSVSGGHHVVGYCNESLLRDLVRSGVTIKGDRWWVAAYGPSKPRIGGVHTWAWQFTDGRLGPQPHACAGIGLSDVSILNRGTYARLRLAGRP